MCLVDLQLLRQILVAPLDLRLLLLHLGVQRLGLLFGACKLDLHIGQALLKLLDLSCVDFLKLSLLFVLSCPGRKDEALGSSSLAQTRELQEGSAG